MARKYVDCRDTPSVSGCTLALIGEEDELIATAIAHMRSVHGHDGPDAELADMVRADLKDAPAALA